MKKIWGEEEPWTRVSDCRFHPVSNTNTPVKNVPPHIEELADRVGRITDSDSPLHIVNEAFGDSNFWLGRLFSAKTKIVHVSSLVEAGYTGSEIGVMFENTPTHLVWFMLVNSIDSAHFKIVSSRNHTLALFSSVTVFETAKSTVLQKYGYSPISILQMCVSAWNGRKNIFERMMCAFPEGNTLWDEHPEYYSIVGCLAPLIYDEPPGVVLGVLCPHVEREYYPEGDHQMEQDGWTEAALWYKLAAFKETPFELRKSIVRTLCLDTILAFSPHADIRVSKKEAELALPNLCDDTVSGLVSLVRRVCLRDIQGFPVLVSNTYSAPNSPAIDLAVRANPPNIPRLGIHKFSPRVSDMIDSVRKTLAN